MHNKPFDLGFLGGGQLARMSIQAAQRMGLKCLSLDSAADTPARQIAPAIEGNLTDVDKVAEILRSCEHVTLENEFIPGEVISQACELANYPHEELVPRIQNLSTIQDKLHQRQAFFRAGVPSPKAVGIDHDPAGAIAEIGFPMVLKARFGGYDGKGTRYAKNLEELNSYRDLWEKGGWLAEEFVPFRRELACMVYVSEWGAGAFPTMETIQTNHVCDLVFPADVDASAVAIAAIEAIGGYGLFGVEMFETQDGKISINELAPRPHNTGHYTLDWGGISQFEQHVRLACKLPTVVPAGGPVCMANLLGQPGAKDFRSGFLSTLADEAVRIHWYGKSEAKPGRKMGHLNAIGDNCVERAKTARQRFYEAWTSS